MFDYEQGYLQNLEWAKQVYQHEYFEQYLTAPEHSSGVQMKQRTAYDYINLFVLFKKTFQSQLRALAIESINHANLLLIKPHVNEDNVIDLVKLAKDSTYRDLISHLEAERFKKKKEKIMNL